MLDKPTDLILLQEAAELICKISKLYINPRQLRYQIEKKEIALQKYQEPGKMIYVSEEEVKKVAKNFMGIKKRGAKKGSHHKPPLIIEEVGENVEPLVSIKKMSKLIHLKYGIKISYQTLYYLLKQGTIPCIRPAREFLLKTEDLDTIFEIYKDFDKNKYRRK